MSEDGGTHITINFGNQEEDTPDFVRLDDNGQQVGRFVGNDTPFVTPDGITIYLTSGHIYTIYEEQV